MFEEILLEDEQKKLLSILVEAVCNTPPDQRQQFVFTKSFEESLLEHPGLAEGGRKVYKGDVEFLADEKLIALSPRSNNSLMFDVTPRGFKYYKEMKQSLDQPTRNIENMVRDYLATEHFQQRYPESYQKWTAAEALLWTSDSDSQLTMIGHLCREAMQEFATALVSKYQPPGINENKANTVARIRAVINLAGLTQKKELGQGKYSTVER